MDELTTREAADVLGVQPKTVTRYILRKLIRAEKRGRDYFITTAELERFQSERKTVGRPKGLSDANPTKAQST